MIDFIGDIHGHASKLEALLLKLGYTKTENGYVHPYRKVVFLGDYIDRGPEIRKTLEIVKSMTDNGNAVALMGNHEYNAICYHTKTESGGYLREHSEKNTKQHRETLKEFLNRQSEWEVYLNWFKTLPLFIETGTYRAVHACWDNSNIDYLRKRLTNNRFNDELIHESAKEGTQLFRIIQETLTGKEIKCPEGISFQDKDGNWRNEIRIKWWEDPTVETFHSISVQKIEKLPHQPIKLANLQSIDYYTENEKMVFFGHYWLTGEPKPQKSNVCCLDYSVARSGKLVAYRLHNEQIIDEKNLIY